MYISAIERDTIEDGCQGHRNGERTISIDEMTGIQATERKEKDLPMRPGKVQLREFEYIRHGTQSLIANFDVASGQVIEPTCGDSRTEEDFVLNIRRMIESDLDATKWHLIMDCLNTHQSESLVRLVAEKESLDFSRLFDSTPITGFDLGLFTSPDCRTAPLIHGCNPLCD